MSYTFGRVTPYGHFLIGIDRLHINTGVSETAFALGGGGGASVWVTQHFGISGGIDYLHVKGWNRLEHFSSHSRSDISMGWRQPYSESRSTRCDNAVCGVYSPRGTEDGTESGDIGTASTAASEVPRSPDRQPR